MKQNTRLHNGIIGSLLIVVALWCIKSAEILLNLDLSMIGLLPQSRVGLLGILFAPLLHGSIEHLFNNTLSILILGSVLYYGYPKSWKKVIGFIWVTSGICVWLFAREATHIGASGLTHGIFFFLLVVSIFRRDKSSVAIMMIAFLMYGGMTMSIFPREETISFEFHFFGALTGAISALMWKHLDPKPVEKKYDWEGEVEHLEEEPEWLTEHYLNGSEETSNNSDNKTLH